MKRLTKISDNVYSWSELHGSENGTYAWNSYAIVMSHSGPVILVDPLPLSDAGLEEIEQLGAPSMIFLTSAWHARNSEDFRARWHCPVCIHELGASVIDIRANRLVKGNIQVVEGVQTIHLPGVYWAEETALLVRGTPPVLIVGDALCGPRTDIGVPPGHVGIFSTEHILDAAEGRKAFERLCTLDFEIMLFGHGDPINEDPRGAIRAFLESHPLWNKS